MLCSSDTGSYFELSCMWKRKEWWGGEAAVGAGFGKRVGSPSVLLNSESSLSKLVGKDVPK